MLFKVILINLILIRSNFINKKPQKVLIICIAGIGDSLMCLPLFHILFKNGTKPDFITNYGSVSLFENTDIVGNVYGYSNDNLTLNNKPIAFKKIMEENEYSDIISIRSPNNLLLKLLIYPNFFNFSNNRLYETLRPFSRILSKFSDKYRKNFYSKKHIVEYNIDSIKHLTNKNNLDYPKILRTNAQILPFELESFIRNVGNFILLHVAGRDSIRKLLPTTISEIVSSDYNFVLVGDMADLKYYSHFNFDSKNVFNAIGLLNLEQLNTLIEKSKLVIAPDSLIMHMSSFLNKPIIAIMGNAMKETWGPIPKSNNQIIISREAKCSPCNYTICNKFDGHSCVQDITANEIKNNISKLYNKDA